MIAGMQTLGLSDSTPRSENRLKSLFWPSIQSGADVDYLGVQGYWLCTLIAVITFVFSAATGHGMLGTFVLLFYYLGGVGIRERSRYAAVVVLVSYVADMLVGGPSVLKVLFTALLLSNLRATWIASDWKPESEEAVLPPRLNQTWSDKFADRFPSWVWPKVRMPYYVFSACMTVLFGIGIVMMIFRAVHPSYTDR
jgi:hypothetical protein